MRYDRQFAISDFHYHSDQFGNVKFLLDSSNNLIEKYTYDAFGAPTIKDPNGNILTDSAYKNRFMFAGREYLSIISMYDYRNRMFSPLLGRFLQTDPMRFDAGDNNLYRYVRHNPVNLIDPTGDYVDMFGFSANFGLISMTSFTAQFGFSYGWRNPLDWTMGYNLSYVDFGDSWTSYTGAGISLVETVAPFANSITSLGTPGSTSDSSGFGLAVPAAGSPLAVSADVGHPTNGNPLTITTGVTFGTPGDRLGYNLVTHSTTTSSGEVSIRSVWNSVVNFFGSIFGGGSSAQNPATNVGIAPLGGGPPGVPQPALTTIIQL